MGKLLETKLNVALGQHEQAGDIRGRGLFWTVEMVADRDTKAPFDPAESIAMKIGAAANARGVMLYPAQGCIDGVHGDHVLLAPPFIIEDDQIGELVEKLGLAIDHSLAAVAT